MVDGTGLEARSRYYKSGERLRNSSNARKQERLLRDENGAKRSALKTEKPLSGKALLTSNQLAMGGTYRRGWS